MVEKQFQEMSGQEMVEAYNALAIKNGHKPIKKFHDRKVGLKRLLAITGGAVMPPSPDPGLEEFGFKADTLVGKLTYRLLMDLDKPVTVSNLCIAVYGSSYKNDKGKLNMVLNGVKKRIVKLKLPFKIVKTKNEKEIQFALQTEKG